MGVGTPFSRQPYIYLPSTERAEPQSALRLPCPTSPPPARENEFFTDNLLVRIHFIIVMIWLNGLAPWEFEFSFPGGRISTFLVQSAHNLGQPCVSPIPPLRPHGAWFSI